MADKTDKTGKDENGGNALSRFPFATLMAGPFAPLIDGPMREMMALQSEAAQSMFDAFLGVGQGGADPAGEGQTDWRALSEELARMWDAFLSESGDAKVPALFDPKMWTEIARNWREQAPGVDTAAQERLIEDSMALWQNVFGQYGRIGEAGDSAPPDLPRSDRRFADPKWREQPVFALLHQTYLLMAEQWAAAASSAQGLPPERKRQLEFYTRLMTEAMSPANFALTNPTVIEKTLESGGENLRKGMQHLIADLESGQLRHTDTGQFDVGRNIAATPGKVVHESDLFQLIQYTPTTDEVLGVPLVIFPPWINRFYILDLSEKKSFVRWAVDQGVSVFMVSWKSADSSMADFDWGHYVRAQIEAIDVVRERLKVPAVHTIGYCVGGTTLAATLAVLARREQADKVASATFFTAQVDFEDAGELKAFIDEHQIAAAGTAAKEGYVDGRYMAAVFNLLRSSDLIWSYVLRNYLLGEDYGAFDMLFWNGDTTNLPARWHREYLQDLYHDNRMVESDSLSVDGTPVDLTRIATPAYIQAGRDDHIAPPESVWKATRHFRGPIRFMLAGSGHIAGVVNPPASGKYQYWTLPEGADLPDTLDRFVEAAKETPGSWWPDWLDWLRAQDPATVPAKGKRRPGGRGDKAIEDAPGRYVRAR